MFLTACSSMGPHPSDLDTMNKKYTYIYYQAGKTIDALNELVMAGVLVEGTKPYEIADRAVNDLLATVAAMEQAKDLKEMVSLEADALSIMTMLRSLIIELDKQGNKDAKYIDATRYSYRWAYS